MIGLVATALAVDALLVALIAIVLLAPLVARIARGRFDPFEPIVVFAVAYGVMFVVRPTAMLSDDSLVYEGPRAALDVSGTFTEMLTFALLGALGFVAGYETFFGARLARMHRRPPVLSRDARLVLAAVLFALVGACSYALLVLSSGGVEFLDAILRLGRETEALEPGGASMYARFLFLIVVPAALVLLALGLERRSAPLIVVALSLAAVVAAQASPLGSRLTLLPLLGGMFALYYVRRTARPSLLTIVVIAVVAVFVSAFLSDLRGRATRGETVAETVARATSPSRVVDSIVSGPDTEMAPVLAAGLSVIPERLSHTYGSTIFGDFVTRPVPRALWNDKPVIPRHKLLAEIWPVEYERGTINAEFSTLLYFYWDFGLLGIVIGLALYGVLSRYLYEYFRSREEHAYAQVLYSLALWFVVIGLRDSPVDTFVRACFILLPVWGIFAVARRPLRA